MTNNATDTSSIIKQFMKITGASEVFLYGGAAIDRYLDHNAKIMDYDIAISDTAEYTRAINKLRLLGFDVAKPRIAHNLSTVAKHKDYGTFDLACMNIEQNGIYNLEKFYIQYSAKYPEGRAVDRYHTVRAMREGRLEIVNNPDKEPAYHLLRRFSVLAGKYNLSLARNGINQPTINTIERRLAETPLSKENEHDRVRCLSRFLGAVLRAKDHSAYLEGIGQTGLMRFAFPQIQELLTDKKFTRSKEVQNSKTKFDLVSLMLDNTHNQDGLIDEIALLYLLPFHLSPGELDAKTYNVAHQQLRQDGKEAVSEHLEKRRFGQSACRGVVLPAHVIHSEEQSRQQGYHDDAHYSL